MTTQLSFDAVFDAQAFFREILDCMARPGEIRSRPLLANDLPIEPLSSGQLAFALSFLNMDSPFSAPSGAAAEFIRNQTGAQAVGIDKADYAFDTAGNAVSSLTQAKEGDPLYPESCPTLIIKVSSLGEFGSASAGLQTVTLSGPGIETQRKVSIGGLSEEFWVRRMEANIEFPLGIDIVLTLDVADQSYFLCLPRTTSAHIN